MVKGVAGVEAVTSGIDHVLDEGGNFDIGVLGDMVAAMRASIPSTGLLWWVCLPARGEM